MEKKFFRASLYVWYLQYWALFDDLVDFKMRAGSGTCLFLKTQHHNVSYERGEGRNDPYRPREMALTHIEHLTDTTCVSPSPAGPAGCCPLNFLYLINPKLLVRAPKRCCVL